MKKFIISFITVIAFLIAIGDIEEVTIFYIILKSISLLWIYLVMKANNLM